MATNPTAPHGKTIRNRPIAVGYLRALDAVARHLNFRAAAEELSLTQSAVSRQVQSLEDEVGVALFLRHTRSVELTSAGTQLLGAVQPSLEKIDSAVRQVRRSAGRKSVAITTWASFASMWLIPRLEAFQTEYPDIDIRIDASDGKIDINTSDVDVALRYALPERVGKDAVRLFGEQLTPVVSPWLLKGGKPVKQAQDLAQYALIEAGDAHRGFVQDWLAWPRWLEAQNLQKFEPKRWLYFNYASQIMQAALTGQGVALARTPLVADSLVGGDLVEVLPGHRLDTPMAYFMLIAGRSKDRPEIKAFSAWLQAQALATRHAIGEEVAPPPARRRRAPPR